MRPQQSYTGKTVHIAWRIKFWYAVIVLIAGIFIIRLFYLQVIRHEYYRTTALQGQLKEYEIPAARGIIEAYDGDSVIPIVLNETKYTLFADPQHVKDIRATSESLQRTVGGDARVMEDAIGKGVAAGLRYVVLAKKLDAKQKQAVENLKLKGIGLREVAYRTYPQGSLGAQIIGFVDDEGTGKYGIEESLDESLRGTSGQLKAITDASGVPLAANKDNLITEPQPGDRVVLTIDIGMQQQIEEILKAGLDAAQSKSGSALIIEVKTGAIKAMANYPSYNPAEFFKVEDANVFNNDAVSSPLEIGSVMKPLTAAAALDLGVVSKNTTYYDPSVFVIDQARVTNIEEDGGAGTRSVSDILQLSLNTGATWLLMQMGGGSINETARTRWHEYMTRHFGFGEETGVEVYESPGVVPEPNEGFGLNIQYANTSFGQGMTATPLQVGAALASVLNGGVYNRPHVIDRVTGQDGTVRDTPPKQVRKDVVSPEVGKTIQELMEYVVEKNHVLYGMPQLKPAYSIGGKTGTAEIAKPGGGYYDDRFNGMFMGFVGGDDAEYVIVVRVNEPGIKGYAGSKAAAPIFSRIATTLIDNFGVKPKS